MVIIIGLALMTCQKKWKYHEVCHFNLGIFIESESNLKYTQIDTSFLLRTFTGRGSSCEYCEPLKAEAAADAPWDVAFNVWLWTVCGLDFGERNESWWGTGQSTEAFGVGCNDKSWPTRVTSILSPHNICPSYLFKALAWPLSDSKLTITDAGVCKRKEWRHISERTRQDTNMLCATTV